MSSSNFANSPQSCFIAFIDNGNVLIIGDSFMDCESSRKEHIVVQNVPLSPTCMHPPTHLFSFRLNYFPLFPQCFHFSFMFAKEPGQSDGRTRPPDENITFSSPRALQESAGKQSGSSERLHKTQELLRLQSQGWSSKINHKQSISKISGTPTGRPLVHSAQQTH